jgi:hypothetical protein
MFACREATGVKYHTLAPLLGNYTYYARPASNKHLLIATFINYGLIFITLCQVYSWPMAWLDFVYVIPYEFSLANNMTDEARNPSWRGRNSTCNLLALISSDQLLFHTELYFFFFAKQPILMRRSTVLNLPFQQGFPGWSHNIFNVYMTNVR